MRYPPNHFATPSVAASACPRAGPRPVTWRLFSCWVSVVKPDGRVALSTFCILPGLANGTLDLSIVSYRQAWDGLTTSSTFHTHVRNLMGYSATISSRSSKIVAVIRRMMGDCASSASWRLARWERHWASRPCSMCGTSFRIARLQDRHAGNQAPSWAFRCPRFPSRAPSSFHSAGWRR